MIHTITPNPAVDRLLMVPELKAGEHIQAIRTAATPAGKGVNVARYLQAVGEKATAWALVGCREVSWFREVLGAAGIGADRVSKLATLAGIASSPGYCSD